MPLSSAQRKAALKIMGLSDTLDHQVTPEEVKKAYHKLALTHHPDKGGDPEIFKSIVIANNALQKPDNLAFQEELDKYRKRTETPAPQDQHSAKTAPPQQQGQPTQKRQWGSPTRMASSAIYRKNSSRFKSTSIQS